MTWLVLVVLAMFGVGLMVKYRAPAPQIEETDEAFTDREIIRAAVELHAIHQRLDVAWTRTELRREADRLRRELAEEMRRVELLENLSRHHD
jgi:hypothetical protein